MDSEPKNIEQLLGDWNAGDESAGQALIESVYSELRRLAAHHLSSERPDHTLQPTALVHELYVKLLSTQPLRCKDRSHFLAIASRQLRHIIVDYARTQGAKKRGGDRARISLHDIPNAAIALDSNVLDLDQALERLEELDARAAQVVELRYFGGLTEDEVGEVLDITRATVKRDWEFARTWLYKEIA